MSYLKLDLEDIVRRSIKGLRSESGGFGSPTAILVPRLHATVRRQIETITYSSSWVIAVEQPLRNFPHLSRDVVAMTLEQYLAGPGLGISMYKNHLARIMRDMTRQVGGLRPDLVIQGPDGVTTVWDLTAREQNDHVVKTMLYSTILSQTNRLTRMGETYWYQPGGF